MTQWCEVSGWRLRTPSVPSSKSASSSGKATASPPRRPYGNAEETIFRWRNTYVPGPSGLDDAVQVMVEDVSGAARTYTLLRDELGTVMGLVAEDEGTAPANPPVPVRYRYTPYGEAHAERAPSCCERISTPRPAQ